MAKIILRFQGQEWTVDVGDRPVTLGRSSKSVVHIKDNNLSRVHCEVRPEGGGYVVADLESMNGTRVNGSKVTTHVLAPGDRIEIGATVVFFEKVPEIAEAPATPPKSPAEVAEAPRSPESPAPSTATRRSPPAGQAARSTSIAVRRFVVWGRPSLVTPGRIWAAVGAIVGTGAAVAGLSLLGGEAGPAEDPGNLLRAVRSFETVDPGKPAPGWAFDGGAGASARVAEGAAVTGMRSLALDRKEDPEAFEAVLWAADRFEADPKGAYRFAAFLKPEGLKGQAYLVAEWRESTGGRVLGRDVSEAVSGAGDWTRVEVTASPPPEASYMRIGIAAAGRAGRVYVDDPSLHADGRGAAAPAPREFGAYRAAATGDGSVSLYDGARCVWGGVAPRVRTQSSGTTAPGVGGGTKGGGGRLSAPTDGRSTAELRMINPVTLGAVPVRTIVSADGEDLLLGFEWDLVALAEAESVTLPWTAAGEAARAPVVVETGGAEKTLAGDGTERGVTRLVAAAGTASQLTLRFSHPSTVRLRRTARTLTVEQTVAADAATTGEGTVFVGAAAGRIGPRSEKTLAQMGERAKALAAEGRSGEALTLWRELARSDEHRRHEKESRPKIAELESRGRRLLGEAEAMLLEAEMTRNAAPVRRAKEALARTAAEFRGTEFAARAAELAARNDALAAGLRGGPPEAAADRLLRLARGLEAANAGELAVVACEHLVAAYGGTAAAREAEELMERLKKGSGAEQ